MPRHKWKKNEKRWSLVKVLFKKKMKKHGLISSLLKNEIYYFAFILRYLSKYESILYNFF